MSTTESKTRGYSMTSAWAFIDATYDSAVREKIAYGRESAAESAILRGPWNLRAAALSAGGRCPT